MLFIVRKYGTILVGTSFLILCFVLAIIATFILTINHWLEDETPLTKIGSAASIIGVFLGTYLAIWLINRDRIKQLEENHVYKFSILFNLEGIIHAVQNTLFNYITKESDAALERVIKSNTDDFQYWTHLIEQINTNTFAPAIMREHVALLLHQGIKPITSPQFASDERYRYLDRVFLAPLSRIIDSNYFRNDRDTTIQHYLKNVDQSRKLLLDTLKLNKITD